MDDDRLQLARSGRSVPDGAAPEHTGAHLAWLQSQERDLLRFGRRVARADGLASWLDDDGRPDPGRPVLTYVTARMAHVYFLGALRQVPGSFMLADKLLRGLDQGARDARLGGWLERQPQVGDAQPPDQQTYTHAFVILAGASGTVCGHPLAPRLLEEALNLSMARFAETGTPMFVDSRSVEPSAASSSYRGVNANMHMVEALLAAADATGDEAWADRAVDICRFVIEQARANHWRIPEHYDSSWTPDLDYNRDRPADPFRPYGATVGHAFEWARLLVQATSDVSDVIDRAEFLHAAENLVSRAASDGWVSGQQPGFVYTTGWDGTPVVADRLHWVAAEAIGAAATLWRATGHSRYRAWYRDWWDFVATYLVDHRRGSWHHQLDPQNTPTGTIWTGKPDLYHAYQAILISELPTGRSLAAVAARASATAI